MVARLKLKGIDGRAPPGVNCFAMPQRLCSRKRPVRVGGEPMLVNHMVVGDTSKLRGSPKASGTKSMAERHWWPG